MYQICMRQYHGSIPTVVEVWKPGSEAGERSAQLQTIPVKVTCSQKQEGERREFIICAEALADLEAPASLSLEFEKPDWTGREYVFFPAAVYDGNHMESRKLPYPPYCAEKKADGSWREVITDIPRLDAGKEASRIQFLSGDMSTPAMGYYTSEDQCGYLMFADHEAGGRYTGFTAVQEKDGARFGVSVPGVREETVYFFGDRPDGSGFYPDCSHPSDDEGVLLKKGETLRLSVVCYSFQAADVSEYLRRFNDLRENKESGQEFCSIPFSTAYDAVKKKCMKMNYSPEGYLQVGIGHTVPAFWQAGWVGGGMNTLSYLLEDDGDAKERALSTLRFIITKLQRENGWYVPMYAEGVCYGDDFNDTERPVLLVRKDADLLYFLLKQAAILRESGEVPEEMDESMRRQADAFVRLYEKNGQIGQFINMEEESLIVGDTASAAIICAALALAGEYFEDSRYLATAEALGELYLERYLQRGLTNGGPGEICQAPDSESAFGLLESYVQLYETTKKQKWLDAAKDAFELAVTWVVSYDFAFPQGSTAQKMGAHTMGTVFANAQNKHSAPGICTLSGNSMLKLYRFTGDEKYLTWMSRISHALSQFVSLEDRPVNTLDKKPLPAGFFNERVQMSDWEGKHTVGEFLYGSNWPETTMLLTYAEIPGIYVDADRNVIRCSDHVTAEIVEKSEEHTVISVINPTRYDAVVTLLADHSENGEKLGHTYWNRMKKISIKAGETVSVTV